MTAFGNQPFSFLYDGQPGPAVVREWTSVPPALPGIAGRQVQCFQGRVGEAGLRAICEVTRFDDYPACEWRLSFENSGAVDSGILEEIAAADCGFTGALSGAGARVARCDLVLPMERARPQQPSGRPLSGGPLPARSLAVRRGVVRERRGTGSRLCVAAPSAGPELPDPLCNRKGNGPGMRRIVACASVWIAGLCGLQTALAGAGDGLPANPMASEDVHKLVAWFTSLPERPEKRFLLANDIWSYDARGMDDGFDRFVKAIHDKTGKWLPMIHVSYGDPTMAERKPGIASVTGQANTHAIAYWKAGGLVHIHINPANPWNGKPYGEGGLAHRERIAELLQPGTEGHAAWMKKLDAYAERLAELRDAGVVVLWRPLHEMNFNNCYWYDAGATRDRSVFQDLWRHMFRYFTYEKKLNNLIWVFSAAETASWGGPDPFSMYPGGEYVDIVGYSQYSSEVKIWPRDLAQFASMNKPFAFSEFGPGGKEGTIFDNMDLIRAVRERYPQAIFATYWHSWTGTKMAIADCSNVEALMNDPWVIDRDELDWRDTTVDLKKSRSRKMNHKAFEFGLRVLPAGDPAMGCPGYTTGGTATPWLIVNRSAQEVVRKDTNPGGGVVRLGPGEIAVHPDATEPLTVVWQSPVSGNVSVQAGILDIDAGVNPQFPGRSDGVIGELRKGTQTLARVEVPNASPAATLTAGDIQVEKGDLLRLVILANACSWFDCTRVSIQVTSADGKHWDMTEAFVKGQSVGNDRPSGGRDALWWACAGGGADFDPTLPGGTMAPAARAPQPGIAGTKRRNFNRRPQRTRRKEGAAEDGCAWHGFVSAAFGAHFRNFLAIFAAFCSACFSSKS